MRATSSIRSTSRVTSKWRSGGTRHLQVLAVGLDPEAEPLQVGDAGRPAAISIPSRPLDPRRRAGPARRRRRRLGGDVDRPRHQLRPAELDHQPRGDPLGPHAELGVELLLEARGGLRAQAEQARGAEDVGPVPVRDLEQDPGRRLGDLGDLAAHDPGDPRGPVLVADQHRLGVEAPLDSPSRVVIVSPSSAARTVSAAVRHPVEVEGVQRLRGEQHHVVGDVDDVVDRPLAGGASAAPAARAARAPIVTSVKTRAVNRGQRSGTSTVTEAQLGHLPLTRRPPRPRPKARRRAAPR